MSLHSDRIAELLAPFLGHQTLEVAQLESLCTYLNLLLQWNSRMNLTSIRDPEQIVVRHFGESLFAAQQLFPKHTFESVIDVGSGAGFPGIPIKIWNSTVGLVLLESNGKKATFLREVVRALGLKQVEVQSTRAESASTKASLVSLRAVEQFKDILPVARKLLQPEGRLALLIGEAQVKAAISILPDFTWNDPIRIPLSDNRVFLVGNS